MHDPHDESTMQLFEGVLNLEYQNSGKKEQEGRKRP